VTVEREKEFCVALVGAVSDGSMSVVSSDVSDRDEIRVLVSFNIVALNVDDSGLVSVETVDGEIVALVRSGDVVVEVSEKWELASLVSRNTNVGARESWREICWIEIVGVREIFASWVAVF